LSPNKPAGKGKYAQKRLFGCFKPASGERKMDKNLVALGVAVMIALGLYFSGLWPALGMTNMMGTAEYTLTENELKVCGGSTSQILANIWPDGPIRLQSGIETADDLSSWTLKGSNMRIVGCASPADMNVRLTKAVNKWFVDASFNLRQACYGYPQSTSLRVSGCATWSAEPPVECYDASDCEGKPHAECTGSWSCEANTCVWNCEEPPPPPENNNMIYAIAAGIIAVFAAAGTKIMGVW
jgi:hypothetical protein